MDYFSFEQTHIISNRKLYLSEKGAGCIVDPVREIVDKPTLVFKLGMFL
jgi:hypothetical protein